MVLRGSYIRDHVVVVGLNPGLLCAKHVQSSENSPSGLFFADLDFFPTCLVRF